MNKNTKNINFCVYIYLHKLKILFFDYLTPNIFLILFQKARFILSKLSYFLVYFCFLQ